jgi:hypothetical protein
MSQAHICNFQEELGQSKPDRDYKGGKGRARSEEPIKEYSLGADGLEEQECDSENEVPKVQNTIFMSKHLT